MQIVRFFFFCRFVFEFLLLRSLDLRLLRSLHTPADNLAQLQHASSSRYSQPRITLLQFFVLSGKYLRKSLCTVSFDLRLLRGTHSHGLPCAIPLCVFFASLTFCGRRHVTQFFADFLAALTLRGLPRGTNFADYVSLQFYLFYKFINFQVRFFNCIFLSCSSGCQSASSTVSGVANYFLLFCFSL